MVRGFEIGPFTRNKTRESNTDTGSAVEPVRRSSRSETLAKIRGEVVAVVREKIIGRAEEFLGDLEHEYKSAMRT